MKILKPSKTPEHSKVTSQDHDEHNNYDDAECCPADWAPEDREEQLLLALSGDAEAAAFINQHRAAFPEAEGRLGNPGHHALEAIILQIAAGDSNLAAALRRQCAEYRRELLSPNPTRLEQMAIDTILVAWAYQHLIYRGAVGRVTMPPAQLQRSQREAQRSHEGALRCLDLVRNKLANSSLPSKQKTGAGVTAATAPSAVASPIARGASGTKRLTLKLKRK